MRTSGFAKQEVPVSKIAAHPRGILRDTHIISESSASSRGEAGSLPSPTTSQDLIGDLMRALSILRRLLGTSSYTAQLQVVSQALGVHLIGSSHAASWQAGGVPSRIEIPQPLPQVSAVGTFALPHCHSSYTFEALPMAMAPDDQGGPLQGAPILKPAHCVPAPHMFQSG